MAKSIGRVRREESRKRGWLVGALLLLGVPYVIIAIYWFIEQFQKAWLNELFAI
jgi:hypothetical protein